MAASAAAAAWAAVPWRAPSQASLALPSPRQLAWQRDRLAMFLHFGINTFTGREWGDGSESPALFKPAALDARQWAATARANGFKAMILTAKHHDGFCLWPSRLTTHTVASSPWRGGQGDVVREFVDACRAAGLGAGLYLSPWDRHEPSYGDSARYNDFYCAQLAELLTNYGPLQEVWFDGANGEGPNGKHQVYDWPRIWGTVRRLQPNALIFSDAGPDLRWIGNERGFAGDPDWCAVDPAVVPQPGVGGAAVTAMLQHGDPQGAVWRPGEADVSLRPGWFYHAAEDARLKSVDELIAIYFNSVGRNAKLLLNVPPAPTGLIAHADANRLAEFRDRLDSLLGGGAKGGFWQWTQTGARKIVGAVQFPGTMRVLVVELREQVEHGQRVSRFGVEAQGEDGSWSAIAAGTTLGVLRLERLPAPVGARRLRVTLSSEFAQPLPAACSVHFN